MSATAGAHAGAGRSADLAAPAGLSVAVPAAVPADATVPETARTGTAQDTGPGSGPLPVSGAVTPTAPAGPGKAAGAAVPAGTGRTAGPGKAAGVPSPARGADRLALPPRRPAPAPPFLSALVAVDCLAVPAAAVAVPAGGGLPGAGLLMQLTLLATLLSARAGLYRPGALASVLGELPALAGRAAVVWGAAALLGHPQLTPARAAAAWAVQLAVVCCGRAAVHHRRRRVALARPRATLVVGPARAAQRLAAVLDRHPRYGLRPVGLYVTSPTGAEIPQPGGGRPALPVLTATEEIHRAVLRDGVRDAVLTGGGQEDLVTLLSHYGCAVWQLGPAGATGAGPVPAAMDQHLWGYGCRRLDPPPAHRGLPLKRLLDVAVAAPLLIGLAPLLLVCAAAVRLSDGPGVLFRQERVGRHGRPFTLLKFRTLRPADEREAATRWSVAHDERLGPVGSFLRRTSLDELPQLWNVLRGDMSLVGPRPERPYFVAQFSKAHPGYAARHRMPVGLTGLAQVHGLRGDTSIEDRCRFDNHYIDHWSLWGDVCILLRTALSLLRPAGS
ncbi:exopolysaccharide biosynthesis polyprenyl glycosylphosphotransferase [Streptomyces sp. LP05-1]|uniref:Exopolysaccharide biosynthesis polyprenyl glycosylphosphotransferase n=1 Tax=Streptomyces pyxinae TaxID=2970734 RepID=A0ABT2CNG2_9ACTN|nr:exopolysaccharide biosynthesis polyprenyl glycosylphosphotransferase [Streptomyces sp. LP05-1]MCS0638980.1 exopolysaccharide biosynthesis polyprenyl glycosylphosphotransferase [Streptomyces sp. LP05-1]